jgi:hypothetical protein
MYIRPPKKRRSSPLRVLILLVLVAAGAYFVIYRRDMIEPLQIGPTPTPTATAGEIMDQAHDLYREGDLEAAINTYAEAASLDPVDPMPYVRWASPPTAQRPWLLCAWPLTGTPRGTRRCSRRR